MRPMNERPLSPHLRIYRLPLTAILSIAHRITGVLVLAGLVAGVACLMAAADGSESFALIRSWLSSTMGRAFLLFWVFSMYLHLCHGLRHLIWDSGHGFAREDLTRHAWFELSASVVLTGLSFLLLA